MAYIRRKTIKGNTYPYRVKSVREGNRVRPVFVSYIAHPPPAAGGQSQSALSRLADFTPLTGADVKGRDVRLLNGLGCHSVMFSLRSKLKHGAV